MGGGKQVETTKPFLIIHYEWRYYSFLLKVGVIQTCLWGLLICKVIHLNLFFGPSWVS
jgi:hypothetical protein